MIAKYHMIQTYLFLTRHNRYDLQRASPIPDDSVTKEISPYKFFSLFLHYNLKRLIFEKKKSLQVGKKSLEIKER